MPQLFKKVHFPNSLNSLIPRSFQGMMSNPEALAAMAQIQSGFQRLQAAAPELYATMGMPNLAAGMNAGGNSSSTASNTTTTTSNSSGSNTTTSAPSVGGGQTPQDMESFRQLMSSMMTGMAANQGSNSGSVAQPPEERFRTQLETLASMGFVDRQANIQGMFVNHVTISRISSVGQLPQA